MKILTKLKEKWIKFWLLDQDFEYDDDIRYTNPVREIQHFLEIYINKAIEINEYKNHALSAVDKMEEIDIYNYKGHIDSSIVEDLSFRMPLPEMKEKVDEYIKLLEENIISKDHISYPHDWTDNICKCLYKSDNLCPYAKECKGIPRKGCQYEKEMVMDLDCCLNQLKERGII